MSEYPNPKWNDTLTVADLQKLLATCEPCDRVVFTSNDLAQWHSRASGASRCWVEAEGKGGGSCIFWPDTKHEQQKLTKELKGSGVNGPNAVVIYV